MSSMSEIFSIYVPFGKALFFFSLSPCLRSGNITDGANPGATSSMSFTRKALEVNTFRAVGKPSSKGSSEQGTTLAKTRLVWGLQHPQATEYTPKKRLFNLQQHPILSTVALLHLRGL